MSVYKSYQLKKLPFILWLSLSGCSGAGQGIHSGREQGRTQNFADSVQAVWEQTLSQLDSLPNKNFEISNAVTESGWRSDWAKRFLSAGAVSSFIGQLKDPKVQLLECSRGINRWVSHSVNSILWIEINAGSFYQRVYASNDNVLIDYIEIPGGHPAWLLLKVPGFQSDSLWNSAWEPECWASGYFSPADSQQFRPEHRRYVPVDTNIGFGFAQIVGDSADCLLISAMPEQFSRSAYQRQRFALRKDQSRLHVNLRFYDETATYSLYAEPDINSAHLHDFQMSAAFWQELKMMDVRIIGCHKDWLKVEFTFQGKTYRGWLMDYCGNPITTCS